MEPEQRRQLEEAQEEALNAARLDMQQQKVRRRKFFVSSFLKNWTRILMPTLLNPLRLLLDQTRRDGKNSRFCWFFFCFRDRVFKFPIFRTSLL
jgi:hypothetical protein